MYASLKSQKEKKGIESLFKEIIGNSLAVQWLRLHAFTAEGPGSGSLVGELSSHKPRSVAKKKKRKNGLELPKYRKILGLPSSAANR